MSPEIRNSLTGEEGRVCMSKLQCCWSLEFSTGRKESWGWKAGGSQVMDSYWCQTEDHNGHLSQGSSPKGLTHRDLWHWLVDPTSLEKKYMAGLLNADLICVSIRTLGLGDKVWLELPNQKVPAINQFSGQNPLTNGEVRSPWLKRKPDPLEEALYSTAKICAVNFPLCLPQRNLWPFFRVTVNWWKWSHQSFGELLGAGSNSDTYPRQPKVSLGLTS